MVGIATEHWAFSGAIRFVGGDVLEIKAANLKGEHRKALAALFAGQMMPGAADSLHRA